MKTNDYLYREIVYKSDEKVYTCDGDTQTITVIQNYNSTEHRSFTIRYGNQEILIDSDNACSDSGSVPAFVARELATIIEEAAMDDSIKDSFERS